jgi:hypothetical protein
MLVFRSLAIGLLGACFLLLVTRPNVRVERELVPIAQPAPPAPATIIDVAHGVSADQLAGLVRLGPGEHVVAVDDRPVAGDLDAGVLIASGDATAKRYLDLTIGGGAGERRVLLLLH